MIPPSFLHVRMEKAVAVVEEGDKSVSLEVGVGLSLKAPCLNLNKILVGGGVEDGDFGG